LSDLCRPDFTFSFSPIPNFAAAAPDDETEEPSPVTACWINSGYYSKTIPQLDLTGYEEKKYAHRDVKYFVVQNAFYGILQPIDNFLLKIIL